MKISVLTASFNSGKYIDKAIQSVLEQDFQNWEHIVIDGGSTDNTLEVLKKYKHLNWVSEPDNGQSDAMNKAFDISTGDIIVYLNADDWFAKEVFGKVVFEFERHKTVDMVIGNLIQKFPDREIYRKDYSTSLIRILDYWPCKFPINPVSYFYRRELQEKIGPFPLDNQYAMDYWFILNAFKHSRETKRIDHLMGYYLLDGENKSSDIERSKKVLKKVAIDFLNKNIDIKIRYNYYKFKHLIKMGLITLKHKIIK
jgi:glycosyltransferase involved in cell wall biosynthesis